MKFRVNVVKKIVKVMFNNEVKVNILFYSITLALKLVIRSSVTIIMKDVNDKSSHIINYISKVPIWIEDVMIYQSFFMLERGTN